MPTPSIQTLRADAQQVLNLDSISAVRSVVAATLANANAGTPLNPNLTTQQLWNEFYQIVTQPKSDIESIIANQLMKFLYAPPAPGGAGADKQVIFNDGGVLAGDPQFLWNKTTNLLTVTGAATITGDLTVDTSTLKVDSANNRVGIGTASPANQLSVRNETASGIAVIDVRGGSAGAGAVQISGNATTLGTTSFNLIQNSAGAFINQQDANPLSMFVNGSERYAISSSGVATWSNVGGVAGTAMTLNSTGLGVGDVPSGNNQFTVRSSGAGTEMTASFGRTSAEGIIGIAAGTNGFVTGSVAGDMVVRSIGKLMLFNNSANAGITIDTAANVGIGVTPSAWGAGYKALQLGNGLSLMGSPLNGTIAGNAWFDGTNWKYITANPATLYYASFGANGSHVWSISSGVPSAGGNVSLTNAMTLDASGNLLVGTTSTSGSASNATKTVGGSFSTVNGATGSIATGVAATLFTAPSESVFMVSAYIVGSSAPANYNAVAIVKVSGGTAAITTVSSALNLTISLSGLNVQATQTSGVNQAFAYSAIRIS